MPPTLRCILCFMVTSSGNRVEETQQDLILSPYGAGALLPLPKLGEYLFQDFCRDLFARDPEIKDCNVYGLRGQLQRGIDLKALREDGACEVGQCKRLTAISPSEIGNVSDEFFKYGDYWKGRDVRRFILFLACETKNTDLHEQIEKETAHFKKKGIAYEVWNQVRITEKARGNADLVSMYFPLIWAQHIGATVRVGSPVVVQGKSHALEIVEGSVIEQLKRVSDEAASTQVSAIRSLWNHGLIGKAKSEIANLKCSTVWSTASPTIKAIALRIEAGLLIGTDSQPDAAVAVAEKARSLDPEADDRSLQALIVRASSGPEAALQELEGPETLEILNLRAQLYLEQGSLEMCEEILDRVQVRFQADAKTYRTKSLLMLSKRDVGSALLAITSAVELGPDLIAVRFAEAVVSFWSSVSPAALPYRLLAAPLAVEWRFVKQDDVTLERLATASSTLADLIESGASEALGRENALSWQLACFGNDRRHQQEASALSRRLLSEGGVNLLAVRWSLARGWSIELDAVIARLRSDHPEADPDKTEVLVQCLLAGHKPTEALEALDNGKQAIQESSEEEAYTYWRAVCLSACERHAEALACLEQNRNARWFALAELSVLRSQEERTVELTDLAESIEKIWSRSNDDRLLLELCELKAAIGDWDFVIEHGERLLSCIETDAVLLLYAVALHNARRFKDCLEVLSANASLFPGQVLPPRFLVVRAASKRALGLISKALTDAEKAVEQDPSLENVLHLLQLKLDHGDQAGLVVDGRILLGMEEAPAEPLLRLSRSVRSYDPQAARRFLEAALERGVLDASIADALDVAYGILGADDPKTEELLARAVELGKQGKGGIRVAPIAELEKLLEAAADRAAKAFELYALGQIPLHLLGYVLGQPLAGCFALLAEQEWKAELTERVPPFIRSGRLSAIGLSEAHPKRLIIDTTGLIVGEMLGLLNAIEHAFPILIIPFHAATSFIRARDAIEMRLAQAHDSHDGPNKSAAKWSQALGTLIERVRRGIADGTYAVMPELAVEPDDQNPTHDLDLQCLRELLLFKTEKGDLLWSDDRYVNGHATVGSARITSTSEILSLLRSLGEVSDESYFTALLSLRRWRSLFLPLDSVEICYYVNKLHDEDGESDEMGVLRRWLATVFLNGSRLQFDPATLDRGEFRNVLDLHRAIEDSVIQIWKDSSIPIEDRKHRAKWVLEELCVSALTMRRLTNLPRDREDPLQLDALGLSGLFTHAFMQLPPSEWDAYFGWIDLQFIAFRERNEPLLARVIAESIAGTLVSQESWERLGLGLKEKPLVSLFVEALPVRIKRFILEDQDVREELGFSPTVSVEEYSFSPDAFYAALEIAQSKGMSRLTDLGGEHTLTVRAIGSLPAREFSLQEVDKKISFAGEELVLLCRSAREREAFLRERRDWFDCSSSNYEQLVDSIAGDHSPRRRVERARAAKESSMAVFYGQLRWHLANDGSFDLPSLIPPDLRAAIRYFGLDKIEADDEGFGNSRELAAHELLKEIPVFKVIQRFSGTPTPLPKALIARLGEMDPQRRRKLLKEALKSPHSSLSQSQFLRLLMRFASDSPAYVRLARRLSASLLSEEATKEATMFLSILAWVENEFSWDRNLDAYPRAAQLGLVWSHTERLHTLFMGVGGDPLQLSKFFRREQSATIPRDIFTRDRVHGCDIALARRLSKETLMLSGLLYGLGKEAGNILNEGTLNSILNVLVDNVDGIPTTRPPFLRDPYSVTDGIGSFLSGDWSDKLEPFFGEDVARIWSRDMAKRMIDKALETLRDEGRDEMRAWPTLQAVLGDLPAPKEYSDSLCMHLTTADYPSLLDQDMEVGMMSFYFACRQAKHFDDQGLRTHLANAVADIALWLENGDQTQRPAVAGLFLDALLGLASAEDNPDESAAKASNFVTVAITKSASLVTAWEPVIWNLANMLPVEQGQQFWPLLLKIRATK